MSRHMVWLLMSQKKTADRIFNPEKYHMNFCHECHGLGETSFSERRRRGYENEALRVAIFLLSLMLLTHSAKTWK